jgi:hypothetical protein
MSRKRWGRDSFVYLDLVTALKAHVVVRSDPPLLVKSDPA